MRSPTPTLNKHGFASFPLFLDFLVSRDERQNLSRPFESILPFPPEDLKCSISRHSTPLTLLDDIFTLTLFRLITLMDAVHHTLTRSKTHPKSTAPGRHYFSFRDKKQQTSSILRTMTKKGTSSCDKSREQAQSFFPTLFTDLIFRYYLALGPAPPLQGPFLHRRLLFM